MEGKIRVGKCRVGKCRVGKISTTFLYNFRDHKSSQCINRGKSYDT